MRASGRGIVPLHISMDGTRVVRIIELYKDNFLVGESFPADVRSYPSSGELPTASNWEELNEYIALVRQLKHIPLMLLI